MRERILEEADTDELLFQIALAAQANGATDWLARVIQRDLRAPGVYRAARALTLTGFLDEGTLLEGLCHELHGRTGFLKDVATCAGERLERNQRARAWFAQFLARRDPVEAWAAFRLFLRCVDRLFYLSLGRCDTERDARSAALMAPAGEHQRPGHPPRR